MPSYATFIPNPPRDPNAVIDGNAQLVDGDVPWNLSPGPRGGQGAFGAVPGNVGLPPVASQLGALFPQLPQANAQVSQNVMAGLRGELSPETIASIQDEAARFGVSSGVPLSDFAGARGLRNLGLSVEGTQRQGLQDYLNAITGISRTQMVDPALQSQIAEYNARMNAAPDPAAAARETQRLYTENLQRQLDSMNMGGRGGGAVTYSGGVGGIGTGGGGGSPGYRPGDGSLFGGHPAYTGGTHGTGPSLKASGGFGGGDPFSSRISIGDRSWAVPRDIDFTGGGGGTGWDSDPSLDYNFGLPGGGGGFENDWGSTEWGGFDSGFGSGGGNDLPVNYDPNWDFDLPGGFEDDFGSAEWGGWD
jgi:hypothetical protein